MGPLPMSYGGRRSFISSRCWGILQQERMSRCGNSRQLSWLERDRQVGGIMGNCLSDGLGVVSQETVKGSVVKHSCV
jgi:hypothetical protein